MKKHSKLLVLVLSLALIIGAFAIIASADDTEVAQVGETKYTSLADAFEAVENDGTVTLIADAKLSATYAVFKNFTIDLNGKTLDVEAETAFTMDAANTLKITGDGDIVLAGTMIKNATKEIAYTFTLEGADKGINVTHKGVGNGVRIVDIKGGTVNVKNVSITSTSTGESADKRFFFVQKDSVGAVINIEKTSFFNDGTPAGNNQALSFISLGGDSTATIKNSTIRCGGSPIVTEENASRDVNKIVLTVENSHLEIASPDNDLRSNLITAGLGTDSDTTFAGTIYFKGSFLGGNCYRGVHGNTPVNKVMRVHVIFDNSVMANNGANDSKGSNDNDTQFTRGATLTFKNNSAIVSANSVGIGNDGVIEVEIGTRFTSLNAAKNGGFQWKNADGSALNKADVKFAYDPMGNSIRPILSTLADNVGITFTGDVKWDFAGMDHGSGQKSMSSAGFYVNNKGNSNFKSDYGDFVQNQPKTGAITNATYGENSMYKYWIPNVVTVNGSSGSYATKEVELGKEFKLGGTECDPYFVFGDNDKYDNAFAPIADNADKSYKRTYVYVVDFDLATDSEYGFPKMAIATTARTTDNKNKTSNTYATLQYDGSIKNSTLNDFNDNIKLSTTEWNHITAVYYTDGETGQAYIYVNGELLGWNNQAYASGTAYIQGFRFSFTNNSTNKAGTSFLVDNLLRRAYTSYLAASEADGGEKAPSAYLLNLPKNTTPLNKNITVNGMEYNNLVDAMAAANELGTYAELNANVTVPQIIKVNGSILLNDYTLALDPESYGAEISYNEKGEATVFKFDESFTASRDFYWYNGEINNFDQMSDYEHYYTKTTVKIGHIPAPANVYGEYFNDYTTFTSAKLIGWGPADTPDEYHPLTKEEAKMEDYYSLPIFGEAVPMVYYVKDATGPIASGTTNAQTENAYAALKDGQTLVLLADFEITSSPKFENKALNEVHGVTLDNDYTEEELATMKAAAQVIGLDLNGYTIKLIKNSSPVARISNNTIFNVYSSKPGAQVFMRYTEIRTGSDNPENHYGIYAPRMFTIYNGGAEDGTNGLTVNNAHINIGAFGEIPGSNLTLTGGVLFEGITGDNSCSINVDGVVGYRSVPDSTGAVMTRAYWGNIIIKNSVIIAPKSDYIIDLKGDDKYGVTTKVTNEAGEEVDLLVEPTPYVYFENCFLANMGGVKTNIVSDNSDSTEVSIEYKNVIANGRLNPSNEGQIKTKANEGVGATTNSVMNLNAPAGIVAAKSGKAIDLSNYIKDTYVLKIQTPTLVDPVNGVIDDNQYVYIVTQGHEAEVPEGATMVVLGNIDYITVPEEDTVSVSFVDNNGNLVQEYDEEGNPLLANPQLYVKGGIVSAPSFNAPEYKLNAVTLVGSDWKIPTEPVTENVVVTADYSATAGVTFKANLSLASDFTINIYVPAELATYVKSAKMGGAAMELANVTVEGKQYLVVSLPVNPENASHEFAFEFEIEEGEYKVTSVTKISVAAYAQEILSGNYATVDQTLMYQAIAYANEAAKYFLGETDATLEGILETYAFMKPVTEENTYEYAIDEITLGNVFASATLNLSAAPEFVLVAKEGFAGTVKVAVGETVYTYEVTAENNTIVITGIKASDFINDLVIYVGDATEATGTYNLDTFAAYHVLNAKTELAEDATEDQKASVEASKKCVDLVTAFYDYVEAANEAANYEEIPEDTTDRDGDYAGDTPLEDEEID